MIEDLPGPAARGTGVVGEDDDRDQWGGAAEAWVLRADRGEVAGLRDRRGLGRDGGLAGVRLGTRGARRAGGQDDPEDEGDQSFGAHARPSRTGVRRADVAGGGRLRLSGTAFAWAKGRLLGKATRPRSTTTPGRRAAGDGKVVFAGVRNGFGNVVRIDKMQTRWKPHVH